MLLFLLCLWQNANIVNMNGLQGLKNQNPVHDAREGLTSHMGVQMCDIRVSLSKEQKKQLQDLMRLEGYSCYSKFIKDVIFKQHISTHEKINQIYKQVVLNA